MSLLPAWITSRRNAEYRPVKKADFDSGSTDTLLSGAEPNVSPIQELHAFSTARRSRLIAFSSLLNVILGLLVVALSVPYIKKYFDNAMINGLIRSVSMPSPILDEIDIPFRLEQRKGSLLPGANPSVFRQEPSKEVDAAWNRIMNINPIPVSGRYMASNGYDLDDIAKWPAEYGLGDDAYIGRLDVFHEIHCLNEIRKEVYFDYYFGDRWSSPREAGNDHKYHVSHCIHVLLQTLMCSSNTNVFPHYWTDTQDEPYPDFSSTRQCRDFESVLDWQDKTSVPMSEYRDVIRQPAGVRQRKMSLEYKYMLRLIKSDPAVNRTAAAEEKFTPILNSHTHR